MKLTKPTARRYRDVGEGVTTAKGGLVSPAGKRVYFEVKRPNGHRVEYGVPTRPLDVAFTNDGLVEFEEASSLAMAATDDSDSAERESGSWQQAVRDRSSELMYKMRRKLDD